MQRRLFPLQNKTETTVSQALSALILVPPVADANAPSTVDISFAVQAACAESLIHTLLVPQIPRIFHTLRVADLWTISRHGTPDHVVVTTKILHRLAWEFMEEGRLVKLSGFVISVYLCVGLVDKRHPCWQAPV